MSRLCLISCLLWMLHLPALAAESRPLTAPVILVLGDSLSAGAGIDINSGWVALLQRRLREQGYGYRVVNASSSGETTGGGRARLPRALQLHQPAIVIIELGGNDGLRGLPIAQMRANLESMIQAAQAEGAQVLLLGMRIPPNYGDAYAEQFYATYAELARRHHVAYVDFFLEGVALDSSLMQPDGIHPTVTAQPKLLENVWPTLRKLLKKQAAAG